MAIEFDAAMGGLYDEIGRLIQKAGLENTHKLNHALMEQIEKGDYEKFNRILPIGFGCFVDLVDRLGKRTAPIKKPVSEPASNENKSFDEWAVVEVMGHVTYAGRVTEQSIGGGSFIRVDVPSVNDRPQFTKILGHGSIYCITPCTESVAREAAARQYRTPMATIGLPDKTVEMFSDEDFIED